MSVSARVKYGCLAALELATRFPGDRPVPMKRMAAAHGISSQFLVQVLQQLKAAGLVSSVRGVSGGYVLSRDPASIPLGMVVRAMKGKNVLAPERAACSGLGTALHSVWRKIAKAEDEILMNTSLADVLRVAHSGEAMYYI
jgi:Rrf2 family protein